MQFFLVGYNFLLGREIMHRLATLNPSKDLMVIKANMKQAYDSMRWAFLGVL
ncbi:hypothetical protein AXF42_Ash005279 [Apostasia shenzhenica]|uniref:Uncharacterized protein n=1 Tax=Apostasia shenzhenica TaxID=1088818 RepID=A0A2I0B6G5_9ASPA|nr:hypothetical protein AXF42_Ash005279 [Apostasia shenzhenica]